MLDEVEVVVVVGKLESGTTVMLPDEVEAVDRVAETKAEGEPVDDDGMELVCVLDLTDIVESELGSTLEEEVDRGTTSEVDDALKDDVDDKLDEEDVGGSLCDVDEEEAQRADVVSDVEHSALHVADLCLLVLCGSSLGD